jgi:DNA transformation protein
VDRPLRELKNLGPKSEAMLAQVGIHTAQQLRSADPFEVYAQLKSRVAGTSRTMLYALLGAIEQRHWQAVRKARGTEILMRLDDRKLA